MANPTTVSYSRVSTDKQDLDKSRHLINEYAVKNKLIIDRSIEVQISTRRSQEERRVNELLDLPPGSTLITPELSRLGRNMMETLNLINDLGQRQIEIIFIRQPELSTTGPLRKLIAAIYSYIAETERDFISIRTKQGLAAAKAKGISLGRRKGSKNRSSPLDKYLDEINRMVSIRVPLSSILKIINSNAKEQYKYAALRYFIKSRCSA